MRTPAAVLVLVLLGCESAEPVASLELSCELQQSSAFSGRALVDLLLVIDRSPAMADLQPSLQRNLPALMTAIGAARGLDARIGVVAADLADGGALLTAPRVAGCQPPDDPFLTYRTRPSGVAATNFNGSLEDATSCIAFLGTGGAPAQPLAAMRLALSSGVNPGFIRPDAYLMVIVLTAGDDPGTEDLDAIHEFLLGIKPQTYILLAAAAVGDASRLQAFTHLAAPWGLYADIRGDFSDLARPFSYYDDGYPHCLVGSIATTPEDLACSVTETSLSPTPVEVALPRCPAARPCWSVRTNSRCGEYFELVIERDEYPGPTELTARCPAVCAR